MFKDEISKQIADFYEVNIHMPPSLTGALNLEK